MKVLETSVIKAMEFSLFRSSSVVKLFWNLRVHRVWNRLPSKAWRNVTYLHLFAAIKRLLLLAFSLAKSQLVIELRSINLKNSCFLSCVAEIHTAALAVQGNKNRFSSKRHCADWKSQRNLFETISLGHGKWDFYGWCRFVFGWGLIFNTLVSLYCHTKCPNRDWSTKAKQK